MANEPAAEKRICWAWAVYGNNRALLARTGINVRNRATTSFPVPVLPSMRKIEFTCETSRTSCELMDLQHGRMLSDKIVVRSDLHVKVIMMRAGGGG
jgi:hypothetical protein